jgi:threonine dehydrogenase-like Zn-dependent dehydrogenase
MKAVVCKAGELNVVDQEPPRPGVGQLLINVLRCGICGSDLHARRHCDELADVTAAAGYDGIFRSADEAILGHEFCGEIVEHGPGTRRLAPEGSRVVAMPLLRRGRAVHPIGLSVAAPGAYAEQMLVEESLAFTVPNGLPTEIAALTEPMAIGWHAVRRSQILRGDVAIVIGCGPVGLAVICMLKARGVRTVVAADLSAGRRRLAEACGADVVVDPIAESPYAARAAKHVTSAAAVFDLAVDAMGKLRRVPLLPWERVYRAAESVGLAQPKRPVIFECVGVPGMLEQVIGSAPLFSRIVVVGVCMEPDRIRPAMAINKEIELRFVLGYTPLEFRDTLHLLADGKVNGAPLVTGTVGLAGVAAAFQALGDPETHAKILIDPASNRSAP